MDHIPDLTIADLINGNGEYYINYKRLRGLWSMRYPNHNYEEALSYSRENLEILEISKYDIYKLYFPDELRTESFDYYMRTIHSDKKVFCHYDFNRFLEESFKLIWEQYTYRCEVLPLDKHIFIKGKSQ